MKRARKASKAPRRRPDGMPVGRPFKPGESGNPSGRPPMAAEVRALALENSEAAMLKLVALMQATDDRVALAACREVLDRAVGKPAQEITGAGGEPLVPREAGIATVRRLMATKEGRAALQRIEELTRDEASTAAVADLVAGPDQVVRVEYTGDWRNNS